MPREDTSAEPKTAAGTATMTVTAPAAESFAVGDQVKTEDGRYGLVVEVADLGDGASGYVVGWLDMEAGRRYGADELARP